MVVTISHQAYWELWDENADNISKFDPNDDLDIIYKYPQQLGQGYSRIIRLRQGIELNIGNYHNFDGIILLHHEREHPLEYNFQLCGSYTAPFSSINTKEYGLCGSGIAPQEYCQSSPGHQIQINVHMEPEVFRSFIGDKSGDLPTELQHLIAAENRIYYQNSGKITPQMQACLQQILQCPYYGITKRMYLEARVLDLMALLVEQEIEARKGKNSTHSLKSDDLERLHHAREILLQNLDNPPSLVNLSRQVGLNECTLKRGFRLAFGTTAFHYLHHYRLEKARQLLQTGDMNVVEVARIVGFASRSYFASAFRKKFGVNPKEYLTIRKNSR
ncbi:MAG: helix-turn-helix domain-containing protein [Nostoc sp.]|uniref:helix-turn-helix transcriptional regulator n=1 Tax=Nostoc sp. TaxID=1180 RepID=UPI002FF45C2D